jgi:hypothetical protein
LHIAYDARAKDISLRARRRSKMGHRPCDPLQPILIPSAAPDPGNHTHLSEPLAFPKPRPRPCDPHAYSRENVYALLTALASNSWDALHERAGRKPPNPRPSPRPTPRTGSHRVAVTPKEPGSPAAPVEVPPKKRRRRLHAMFICTAIWCFACLFASRRLG